MHCQTFQNTGAEANPARVHYIPEGIVAKNMLDNSKEKPKNVLSDAGIKAVAEAYAAWETREKLSRVVTLEEIRAADYNLSPSQFVEVNDKVQHRPISDILADLTAARAAREQADTELTKVLTKLGLN